MCVLPSAFCYLVNPVASARAFEDMLVRKYGIKPRSHGVSIDACSDFVQYGTVPSILLRMKSSPPSSASLGNVKLQMSY